MFIATGSVTINAAFLREIKEDNRELRNLLQRCEATTRASAVFGMPGREMVTLLGQLRDQLALHFSLEEAYGYFDDALIDAPQLNDQANALRNEHEPLFKELCRVVEQAERWLYNELPSGREPTLAKRFEEFHRRLQRHEQAENHLILECYDGDVGVGD